MSSKFVVKVESSLEQQENLRNSRKSLKVLQRASKDKENLVRCHGPQKAFVKSKSENDFNDTANIKRKKLTNPADRSPTSASAPAPKARRSSELLRITEEDVQGDSGAEQSEGYWRELAEKRRLALDATLTENQELHEYNASLKEQLDVSNHMLDESRNLVEILTELLEENESEGNSTKATSGGGFERGECSKRMLDLDASFAAVEADEQMTLVPAKPGNADLDADDEDDSCSRSSSSSSNSNKSEDDDKTPPPVTTMATSAEQEPETH